MDDLTRALALLDEYDRTSSIDEDDRTSSIMNTPNWRNNRIKSTSSNLSSSVSGIIHDDDDLRLPSYALPCRQGRAEQQFNELRAAMKEKETRELTFKPQVNTEFKFLNKKYKNENRNQGVVERLMSKEQDKKEKIAKMAKEMEELEIKSATFQPEVNARKKSNEEKGEKSENIHERLFNLSKSSPTVDASLSEGDSNSVRVMDSSNTELIVSNASENSNTSDKIARFDSTRKKKSGNLISRLLHSDAQRRDNKIQEMAELAIIQDRKLAMESAKITKKSQMLAKKKIQKELATGYAFILRNFSIHSKSNTIEDDKINYDIFVAAIKHFDIKVNQIVIDSRVEHSKFVSYHRIDVDKYCRMLWHELMTNGYKGNLTIDPKSSDAFASVEMFVTYMYPIVTKSTLPRATDGLGGPLPMIEDEENAEKAEKINEVINEIAFRLCQALLKAVEEERISKLKSEWEGKAIKECTFTPKINHTFDNVKHLRDKVKSEFGEEKDKNATQKNVDNMTIYELLFIHGKAKEKSIQNKRTEKDEKEKHLLTFKPTREAKEHNDLLYKKVYGDEAEKSDVYSKLYNYMSTNEEKEKKAKEKSSLQREVKSHCTFVPNTKKSKEFYKKEQVDIPRGYEDRLKHMKNALKERQHKLEVMKKITLRSDDGVMRPKEERKKFIIRKAKLIFNLNVNIDEDGGSGLIRIREGDDANLLAYSFAKRYNLNEEMRGDLQALITMHIEDYYNKKKGIDKEMHTYEEEEENDDIIRNRKDNNNNDDDDDDDDDEGEDNALDWKNYALERKDEEEEERL